MPTQREAPGIHARTTHWPSEHLQPAFASAQTSVSAQGKTATVAPKASQATIASPSHRVVFGEQTWSRQTPPSRYCDESHEIASRTVPVASQTKAVEVSSQPSSFGVQTKARHSAVPVLSTQIPLQAISVYAVPSSLQTRMAWPMHALLSGSHTMLSMGTQAKSLQRKPPWHSALD